MPGKLLMRWAAGAALILSAGCCHWCEEHCSTCRPATACCQPAAPVCCQPCQCAPAAAGYAPAAPVAVAPAAAPAQCWCAPAGAPVH
jgi:hypothetical protein